MGGDHMCPVCSATFTRPQHVARHMRSHTGDRPYACQMCGDRFARSDLLSRHVNKCHTPGGLANTSSRKNQGSSRAQPAEDKKRKPCDACSLQSTKCDFGKPCNNCSSRGTKCAYSKTKRPRRNTNPSPATTVSALPDHNAALSQESMPINSFGTYQDDMPPFHFNYSQDSSLAMPHLFEPSLSVSNPNSGTFMGSPEAPPLSFSAATSDSTDSSPWNGFDVMGLSNMPNGNFDNVFHDPNAPSFTSTHKIQPMNSNQFGYNLDHQTQPDHQLPLTALHQRPGSATLQRHPIQHHQRHRSSPSLDGSHGLLNHALLRAQGQQYPAITPSRLYMHRGSLSASDSGTDYESSGGRPSTAGEYPDFPSPMSLVNSETGSTTGVGRSIDDMSLHDPGASSLLSMGPMMLPGIGMGTGLTPAGESPSRPSMAQRQSTFGDLKAFWNECMDNNSNVAPNGNGIGENRSLARMTSMPCLKTPLGDASATPRATAQDPLARLGSQQRTLSGAAQTPRAVSQAGSEGLEQYQSALNARPAPSLQMAPKMKAAVAKQEDTDNKDHSFAAPFLPGSAQADAWRSLMSGTGGSYVADSGGRPNYKRLPSQTLGPENSKRAHHGEGGDDVFTDEEEENEGSDYGREQEWRRRMSLPVMGRSGTASARLHQPMPVPASRPGGVLN